MGDSWERFTCLMPPKTYRLLEEELERIRLLADIDPEEKLSQEVRDGLTMEYLVMNSMDIGDEEVI